MPGSADSPVLILTGPPGVGKTTAAAALARRPDRAVHLEADVFFRFIGSGHIEPWREESHSQNQTVMSIVATAAAGYASAGYLTIIDGIVVPDLFLEPIRDALHGAGHRVAYAVLRAPLALCLERVRARSEGEPLLDSHAVEQLWRSFADLGGLELNALEVGDCGPDEVSALLTRSLASGALEV